MNRCLRVACRPGRIAACVCACLSSAPAAPPPAAGAAQAPPAPQQAAIDAAIVRGVRFILESARTLPVQGDWHPQPARGDYRLDELILFTLLQAGTDRGEPAFQALLRGALEEPLTKTYRVGLTAMVCQALGDEGAVPRLVDCAQFLVDNQCGNGQWSYGEPVPLPKRSVPAPKPAAVLSGPGGGSPASPPAGPGSSGGALGRGTAGKARRRIAVTQRRQGPPTGDNSNSQYAALGLRACIEAGVDVQADVLRKSRDWWEQQQNDDGGWAYGASGAASYGSMTAGGVGCLSLYKSLLRERFADDPRVLAGLRWLAAHFTVRENPGDAPEEWDRQYYYLYALERAGRLVRSERIGSRDWYAEGAAYLLKNQAPGGAWHGEKARRHEVLDTCYAILFLRRATRPLQYTQ